MSPLTQAGFLDQLSSFGSDKQPVFLPPDEAFSLQLIVRDAETIQANYKITPGYYLYRDKIKFSSNDERVTIAAVNLPRGDIKQDPNFGEMEVFHQSFQAEVKLERHSDAPMNLVLDAAYMGCSEDGLCYPPITKTLSVSLPDTKTGVSIPPAPNMMEAPLSAISAAPANENSKIADILNEGSLWLVISFFFGAGLLLSLTPCVFPMIPILSGIIVGHGPKITKKHAFMLSLAYVLGMAVTYALAGVAAGYSGHLISNALQTPWVLGSFAGVFVLLSLSMFGLYELQLPAALQSKLTGTSNKLHGGHLSGVFVMGALSAIIMGPCVAAPLAGALLFISQTHDAVLGGIALFVMALGMGVPLLLIGTSAGVFLPKAGAWMAAVKQFFGVMLLALAIWIIQPLLPISVQMLLWASLLIFSGIHLHALESLPQNATGGHKFFKGLGVAALLLGTAYLIGGLSGSQDILRPLGNIGSTSSVPTKEIHFSRVKDVEELDKRIVEAKGQVVMLDFYADWCISCKEMERFTFSDPAVQAKLNTVLLLQADVTANSDADKALLKRFGLFGPPGIIFFNVEGQELIDFRVIGYQGPEQFLESLDIAGI
jgi:thiol:disulfide interchange protein DsbD